MVWEFLFPTTYVHDGIIITFNNPSSDMIIREGKHFSVADNNAFA